MIVETRGETDGTDDVLLQSGPDDRPDPEALPVGEVKSTILA